MVTPAVLERARRIWEARERTFPKFTRMRFEDGSAPARAIVLAQAAAELAGAEQNPVKS